MNTAERSGVAALKSVPLFGTGVLVWKVLSGDEVVRRAKQWGIEAETKAQDEWNWAAVRATVSVAGCGAFVGGGIPAGFHHPVAGEILRWGGVALTIAAGAGAEFLPKKISGSFGRAITRGIDRVGLFVHTHSR